MPGDGVIVNEFGQPIGPGVAGWTPPPSPEPIRLDGSSVRVEAFESRHLPGLFDTCCAPELDSRWTYLGGGPCRTQAELSAYVQPMLDADDWWPVAFIDPADNAVIGMASYLRIAPSIGAAEIGAILYSPRMTRTRAATEAMYLLARHAFELGYRRYEWKCDDLNGPSKSAAVRLGFRPEGVWRNATIYKGRSRDTAWFAMTDEDWRRLRPAYEQWLEETAGGNAQQHSLGDLTAAALPPTAG